MASGSELFNTWKEGFANKDSSKLADLLTDDFQFVGKTRNMTKQEALDWTAAGGNPTAIDNLEVLFENDDVAVIHHSARRNNSRDQQSGHPPVLHLNLARTRTCGLRCSRRCIRTSWRAIASARGAQLTPDSTRTGRDPVRVESGADLRA